MAFNFEVKGQDDDADDILQTIGHRLLILTSSPSILTNGTKYDLDLKGQD